MHNLRAVALPALLAAAVISGCTCGGGKSGSGPEPGKPGDLSPIPEPPAIPASQEALPSGPLAVVASKPTGLVYGEVRPTITFSKPVVALGTVEQQGSPKVASIEPAIPGEWRWLGSASVEFVPQGLVPYSTRFKVTVQPGVAALDGGRLAEAHAFEFSTPAPQLQEVEPKRGWRWVSLEPTFSLTFNQPVKDLASKARLTANGKPITLSLVKEVALADEKRAEEGERHYPRQSFEERGSRDRRVRYELKPTSKLPLDAALELRIAPDLAGKDGPLTLGQEELLELRTYGKMQVTAAKKCRWDERCPFGPVVLHTTNRADVASIKGKVSFDPPVEVDWEGVEAELNEWSPEESPWITVPGKFRPGTTYQIKVAAGLADEAGQRSPAFQGSVELDDLLPAFSAGSRIALIEAARGDGALPLESVNVTSGSARIWALSAEELAVQLSQNPWSDEKVPEPPGEPTLVNLDLTGTPNVVKYTPLDLRQALPEGQKTGFFLVKASSPEVARDAWERGADQVIAQITDIAVHAKLGTKSGVLWVTSLSKATPIEGARVRILNRQGETRWEGTSDAEGLVRVPGVVELGGEPGNAWDSPFALAVAEKDGDAGATLSWWNDGLAPSAFELQTGWDGEEPVGLGLVFSDRGIYRPGDEVFFKGLARVRRFGDLGKPAKGTSVTFVVTDPRGNDVFKKSVPANEFGTFASDFKLPAEAALGTYFVNAHYQAFDQELQVGGSFRVEEYRAPQFQVDVTLPQRDAVAGDELKATVLARYLFGAGMNGAQVRWTSSRSSVGFSPPNNAGFEFGVQTWWWDDERPSGFADVWAGGEGQTDAAGAFQAVVGKADAPGGKTFEYTVEAEVTDVNRQRTANRATVTVHPASAYAGVRQVQSGFAEAGKTVKLELVAASPDGARQAGKALSVEIRRRDWKSIRKKGAGGEWFTTSEPEETKVAGCELKSEATPVPCEFKPEKAGLYVVEASVADEKGRKQVTRTSLYAIGGGWVSWQRNDSDRIDLVADKATYDAGDTARILVKSPYPEAEALLTVEREGVLSTRRVKLTGAAATLDIPLDESLVPNAFVGLVIARGRVPTEQGIETGADPGRPAVRVGYTELRIEKKAKRLSVSVAPDAAEKRPRDKVKVGLKVADYKGAGRRAEVAVWAVDEGVLRLTDYQIPDLVEAIHPLRGLSVRIGEPLLHLVLARVYGEKGTRPGGSGGGDASGSGFRSRFKTTVLFQSVVTDSAGNAQVEFELPDNLTTFRIMAVAATEGDLFGGGESKVVVNKPLLALPALPRLARVGDKLEAGVVVHSKAGPLNEVKVTAQAEGLTLDGPAERTISLADGKPREVRFGFTAASPGTATLRFAVQSGAERDGVEQKLPVLLPTTMEAVAAYGDTSDKRTEGLVPPGGIRPDVGGLEVTLASTALAGFDEGMRQLVDYPYGCVEQLSSRLVPFIALREIQSKFGLTFPDKPEERTKAQNEFFARWLGSSSLDLSGANGPDEIIRRSVKAIEALQNPDGGFRYWSDGACSDQYASAYATLALYRAREVGFQVSEQAIKDGQKFLADNVAAGKCVNCGWGCHPPADATRVFALWSLARTRAPKPSYYGELYGRREALPLFAKAMLADAMYVGRGDRAQAKQLTSELMNFAKESAAEVHFEEADGRTYASLWSSDTRTTAIALQTLTSVSPDHPFVAKMANYLARVRKADGRYRNTQEAAFALMALTEVTRTKEKDAPDFAAKVLLGEQEIAAVPFRGRTTAVERVQVPAAKLASLDKKLPLVFSRDGSAGVLYYGALLRYAPAEMPTDALDRGLVVQRWFEPYEGGGQARSFFAGDLVRVRVRVGTHMERHFLAVDVPLPAGLEAVDITLATTARLPSQPREEGPGEAYENEGAEDASAEIDNPFAYGFYSPFNHREMRDDRVVYFSDRLPPGVHTLSFVARATTPGDFVLKPAHGEEMYSPETFGRSDGGRFKVVLPASVAQK